MSLRLDSPNSSLRPDDLPGHVCPSCGGEVLRHTNADYCSHACLIRGRTAARAHAHAEARRGMTCPMCGIVFDAPRRSDQICCSPGCASRLRNSRYLAKKSAAAAVRRKGRRCLECGAVFDAATGKQVYCSQRCRWRAERKRRPPRR